MTLEQATQLTDEQLESLSVKFEKELAKQYTKAEKMTNDENDTIDGIYYEDWATEQAVKNIFGSHEVAEACGC